MFVTDDDRKVFLHRLGQVCESHGWKVHAWVLMGNHFHLLLETPEPNLVSGMKWLLSAYSQGWSRAHMRRGHVFQGRYKAVPVNASDSAGDGASWFSKPIRLGRQSGQYDAEIDQKDRKNVNPCTLTPLIPRVRLPGRLGGHRYRPSPQPVFLTPFSPPSGPTTRSFNGLHHKSKFLAFGQANGRSVSSLLPRCLGLFKTDQRVAARCGFDLRDDFLDLLVGKGDILGEALLFFPVVGLDLSFKGGLEAGEVGLGVGSKGGQKSDAAGFLLAPGRGRKGIEANLDGLPDLEAFEQPDPNLGGIAAAAIDGVGRVGAAGGVHDHVGDVVEILERHVMPVNRCCRSASS